MKIQDPISKQTLMKSNAQLRHEDEAPQPPLAHVEMPDIASSSQTAPLPPQHDAGSLCSYFSCLRITTRGYEFKDSLYAARDSLYQSLCGAVPAGHLGVSPAPSSVK
jgi:hypothetical protein